MCFGSPLQVPPEALVDFELQLCDTQPSVIGGALNEFVISGRLDNLCSSYQALRVGEGMLE
jgi:aspartyl aminopeptidase